MINNSRIIEEKTFSLFCEILVQHTELKIFKFYVTLDEQTEIYVEVEIKGPLKLSLYGLWQDGNFEHRFKRYPENHEGAYQSRMQLKHINGPFYQRPWSTFFSSFP